MPRSPLTVTGLASDLRKGWPYAHCVPGTGAIVKARRSRPAFARAHSMKEHRAKAFIGIKRRRSRLPIALATPGSESDAAGAHSG